MCHRARERLRRRANLSTEQARRRAYQRSHRAENALRSKLWREANPDRVRSWFRDRERRKRIGRNADTWAWIRIIERDPCSYCGGEGGTIDHVEPLSTGGSSDWSNLVSACMGCNRSKRAFPLLVYLQGAA